MKVQTRTAPVRALHRFKLCLMLCALPLSVLPVMATAAAERNARVTLNFVDAEISTVVRAISQYTGKVFLLDPRVKGQISLVSEEPVTSAQAYRLLTGALRLQGLALVDNDGIVKVVPEADGKLQGGTVIAPQSSVRGDQLVTQIFRLNVESATSLVPILRPLISANNPINAYPANNTLVITDYAENLKRIAQIIASIDTPTSAEVEVIPVRYGIASDVATLVNRMLDTGGAAGTDAGQRVSLMADPNTNSILIRSGSAARAASVRRLIDQLDTPNARQGNMHVVYLKNAEAGRLAQTLRGVLMGGNGGDANSTSAPASSANGMSSSPAANLTTPTSGLNNSTSTPLGNAPNASAPGPGFSSGGVTVQADTATNTLIVIAPEALYRGLREIIDKLDVRRAQIFVETLIVEVTSDKAAEFGIQWLGGLDRIASGDTITAGGTNFGGAGQNIISGAQNLGNLGKGLNIGVIRGSVTIAGLGTITNLGVLARALETNNNANILSTPNLLTLDNEEAKIVIGQNVPFITGQYAQGTTGTTVNPFQTIERQDVGLTLRVRPQVSDGGVVKLNLFQEVSSVQDTSLAAGIITNKRTIESNVLVDDGQIVVIGGLVQDSSSGGVEKVPGLGDIPAVGALFRYDTRKRNKTSLMVFMRPHVLRDPDAAHSLLVDRYDYMRQKTLDTVAGKGGVLRAEPGPVLPARNPDGQPPSGLSMTLSISGEAKPAAASIP